MARTLISPHQQIIIVGAGIGGLASAALLAQKGFRVTVLERGPQVGGRCGQLVRDGFRFDTGPTLFLMKDIFEELFFRLGTRLEAQLNLIRVDPHCRLDWADGATLDLTADMMTLSRQCETFEPGCTPALLHFLGRGFELYQHSMKHLLRKDFSNKLELLHPGLWGQFIRPDTWRNRWKQLGKYFKSERLRQAFSCQDLYIGMSPHRAPAIYQVMPAMELVSGLYFPKGGMFEIARSFEKLARQAGAEIRTRCEVVQIMNQGNRITGVALNSGETLSASAVLANADVPHVNSHLLPPASQSHKKWHTSCSAHTFYFGLRRPLTHLHHGHAVYFGSDWRAGMNALSPGAPPAKDPHFYTHAPTRMDPRAAPKGGDSVMVVVPCAPAPQDSPRNQIRTSVIKRLSLREGRDISKDIVMEAGNTPATWESKYHLLGGAVFGSLDHRLGQMGPLRPGHRHPTFKNLFFAGGSTRPASGVPMVILSAMLATDLMQKEMP